MQINVITAFTDMFNSTMNESILKKAQEKGYLKLDLHDLRDYTTDKHRQIDDTPYGGGPGMLLKIEPFYRALKAVKKKGKSRSVLLSPHGQVLNQKKVQELAQLDQLILLCGHYEGVDERVRDLVDEEISLGDFVLTGGELAAMVLIDAVTRKQAGVLGSDQSLVEESFEQGLLEYPQYTKPAEFEAMSVPEILLSGNHQEIEKWRKEQAIKRTKERRPDLFSGNCNMEDKKKS